MPIVCLRTMIGYKGTRGPNSTDKILPVYVTTMEGRRMPTEVNLALKSHEDKIDEEYKGL